VAIAYLSEHEDAKATKAHVEAEGTRCLTLAGDVRDPRFCEEAVAKTVRRLGRLDVLVNNAAFQQHADKLEDITDAHLQETLQTNIAGYIQMARAALPHLKEGSAIVNCGSETGIFGNKALIDYSATKGAVHAFTKALAANLLERGIRVNAVAPGPVWTPFNPADKPADEVAKFGDGNDDGQAELADPGGIDHRLQPFLRQLDALAYFLVVEDRVAERHAAAGLQQPRALGF